MASKREKKIKDLIRARIKSSGPLGNTFGDVDRAELGGIKLREIRQERDFKNRKSVELNLFRLRGTDIPKLQEKVSPRFSVGINFKLFAVIEKCQFSKARTKINALC